MSQPIATGERGVPAWLLAPAEVTARAETRPRRRRRASYLDRTLASGAALLRQVMFSEELAGRPGLLQRIDPRVKIASCLAVLIAAALAHPLVMIAAVYAFSLVIGLLSRLPARVLLGRVWLFVPAFTAVAVLPATLSVITPGRLVWHLFTWHGVPQGITEEGLRAAALVVVRVAASVSLVRKLRKAPAAAALRVLE